MSYLLLAIAIGSEIVATTFLKSEIFRRIQSPHPNIGMEPVDDWFFFAMKGMSMLKSSISIKISQNLTK